MKSPYTILALCLCGCREVGCWHVYHRDKAGACRQFRARQDPEWPLRIISIQNGILNTVNHFSDKGEHSARIKGKNAGLKDVKAHSKDKHLCTVTFSPYGLDSEARLHELWAEAYENAFEGNKRRK